MRRRQFVTLVGGAAAVWPFTARAQQTERIRTVGILLGSTDNPEVRRLLDAFMESFKLLGWTEHRNVRFDIRWTGGSPQNNTVQAQELVRQRPDVIFAALSNVVIALQKETHSIPIVFANVSDPIAQGVVDNLARPTAAPFRLLPPCIQTMTGNDWLDDVAGVHTFKYRQSSSIRLLSGSRSPSRLLWTQRGPHSAMLRMPFHGCTG